MTEIKYTKPTLSFPELGAGALESCQQLPGAVDRNGTQECTNRDLNQDFRQDKEQGPLQKPPTDEGSKTLMMPQL